MKSMGVFVLSVGLALVCDRPAWGRKEFKEGFDSKYIKDLNEPTITAEEKALAAAAKGAGCSVCHVKGEEKKVRNTYGAALAKILTKADTKNAKKIQDALDTVAGEKSDPNNPDSATFGELIKAGKLPGK